ncbi:uncharacterized protein LOC144345235 [Saccoglossus kowalevskii]
MYTMNEQVYNRCETLPCVSRKVSPGTVIDKVHQSGNRHRRLKLNNSRQVAMTKTDPSRYSECVDEEKRIMQEGKQRRLQRKMIDKWVMMRRYVLLLESRRNPFPNMDSTLHIPCDPMEWSPEHVTIWLDYMARRYNIQHIPYESFQMNGKGLCIMPKPGFLRRVPRKGHLMHHDLYQRIKQSRFGIDLKKQHVPLNLKLPSKSVTSTAIGKANSDLCRDKLN